jgi:hypothetical protein
MVPIFPRYPGIARAVARHLAIRAVEQRMTAEGLRVAYVPHAAIVEQALAYLAEHSELFDQAAEIVRTHPSYRHS